MQVTGLLGYAPRPSEMQTPWGRRHGVGTADHGDAGQEHLRLVHEPGGAHSGAIPQGSKICR